MNFVSLVGRLVKDPELFKTENGKSVTTVTLAIPRGFKNMNGEYETDFIDCTLWENAATNTCEYCHKGETLCIRGRIGLHKKEIEDKSYRQLEIIADKVTFL